MARQDPRRSTFGTMTTSFTDSCAISVPFWRIMELIWEHMVVTLGTLFEEEGSFRITPDFYRSLGEFWGGPTRNPIEPARSKRMSALSQKYYIFNQILLYFWL